MVLTRIAWAAIVTPASMVSYDLQVRVWHTVHALCFYILGHNDRSIQIHCETLVGSMCNY